MMRFCNLNSRGSRCAPGAICLLACLVTLTLAADGGSPAAEEQFRDRLAAGEFGPALDFVDGLTDRDQQVRLWDQIAAAQRRAGETRGAAETARRSAAPAAGAAAPLAGGASNANFTELMNLIQNTIEIESWSELGGKGTVAPFSTGVYVDPAGLLRTLTREEQSGRLERLSRRARAADLSGDLARPVPLRFVSLRELERTVARHLAQGQSLPETVRRLAGLTRVRQVVADPEERDVLLAGPAEPWRYDDRGRPLGAESGRPMLDLDDLVVVLRAFAPGAPGTFGCSINTRDENLRQVREFVEASNRAGPLGPGRLNGWLKQLHERLGLQDVVVHGVPETSRVAQILVEADYKMKLIGVAKLDAGPDIPSYFELLRRAGRTSGAPLEALRWWLSMQYEAILHSPDRDAFEIQGPSVLMQSENQFVNAHGQHLPTGAAEPLNRQFAENFTRHYAGLALRDAVFADLENVFDMALLSTLLHSERLLARTGLRLEAFAPRGDYRPAEFPVPKVIDSVINHRVYGGTNIVVQVAGGVQADVRAVATDSRLARKSTLLAAPPRAAVRHRDAGERWWWDASD